MGLVRLTLSLVALALACGGTPAGVPLPECSQEPSTPDTFVPHPTECNLFYLCSWGGLGYLKQCPEGLVFNPDKNYCDFPYNVVCGDVSNVPPRTTRPPPVVAPPDIGSQCPPPQETVVLLPNPEDCLTFYMCVDAGLAFLHKCPEGLAYNPDLHVCDYPGNFDCMGSRDDAPQDPPAGGTGGAEGGQQEIPSADMSRNPVPAEVLRNCVFGPKGEEPRLQANPSDCHTFYQCVDNGVAVRMPCAANLYFDARRQICNYQKNAKCPV
ncbi:protein obstructor-E-like [Oratosquilla oratoria]|uniref:protein obstructor-E-like n=1 Tax=Oratosquilla oratoria TaxID=337810 RepID=UPI003F75C3B1